MQLPAMQTSAACRPFKHLFACCLLLTGFALPLSAWAVDTDGDGVDDSADAFPTYPEATTDTDGDGQPDVLNNIIFQDSFNGTVQADWTGVVAAGSYGWQLDPQHTHFGTPVLKAYASDQMVINLSRSVVIPAQGGTVSYWNASYTGISSTSFFNMITNSLFKSSTWTQKTYALSAGVQTLTWKTSCRGSGSFGIIPSTCGFIDDVEVRFNSLLVEDTDDDNDGVLDVADRFPLDATESVDTDNDGIGNNADTDDDNDGVPDYLDPEPLNPANSSVWPLNNNYQGSAMRESQEVQ